MLDYEQSSAADAWGGAALTKPHDPLDERIRFFREVNPIGKVPAIDHGGHVVSESGAICAYLAETFPDAGLTPTPAERAAYHRWMFFTAGPVEQAVKTQAFIAGDRFIAADVYVGSHIGWGLGIKTLPPREAFLTYAGRLSARSAYQRAVAKDEALLVHTNHGSV